MAINLHQTLHTALGHVPVMTQQSRKEPSMAEKLLRRPEVQARTGLSRSTIYDWVKRGEFPRPVKLGTRLVAWRESDISDWLESREKRAA